MYFFLICSNSKSNIEKKISRFLYIGQYSKHDQTLLHLLVIRLIAILYFLFSNLRWWCRQHKATVTKLLFEAKLIPKLSCEVKFHKKDFWKILLIFKWMISGFQTLRKSYICIYFQCRRFSKKSCFFYNNPAQNTPMCRKSRLESQDVPIPLPWDNEFKGGNWEISNKKWWRGEGEGNKRKRKEENKGGKTLILLGVGLESSDQGMFRSKQWKSRKKHVEEGVF